MPLSRLGYGPIAGSRGNGQSGSKIWVFEPSGGIDASTIGRVVEVCAENGAKTIVPHIYSSIIDPSTGLTRTEDVKQLMKLVF